MARNKADGGTTVSEPDGVAGIQTRLVLMSKAKPETPAPKEGQAGADIKWVLKPMVARSRGRGKVPPSIGSMPIPGKP